MAIRPDFLKEDLSQTSYASTEAGSPSPVQMGESNAKKEALKERAYSDRYSYEALNDPYKLDDYSLDYKAIAFITGICSVAATFLAILSNS